MKIYRHGDRESELTMIVTPGNDRDGKEVSDFFTDDNRPVQFTVQFHNHCAEVIDPLGKYMVAKQMASDSAICHHHQHT